ncbi:uncharacterized protein METZ01_LOCUS117076 [marine metagenome]|uniref:Uncharacterized protein n=1 Tax=marine metagenome TaxID=408172 RepID=A0A381XI78_9ZZZZ
MKNGVIIYFLDQIQKVLIMKDGHMTTAVVDGLML